MKYSNFQLLLLEQPAVQKFSHLDMADWSSGEGALQIDVLIGAGYFGSL